LFEKSSKYVGVSKKDKPSKKPWQARLFHDGKTQYFGCFKTEREAAKAVNAACKKYNIPIKNKELSHEEEEEEETFSSPKIFVIPSENNTWANHCYWPIAVIPGDFDAICF
jgi:hypothetical protein